MIFEDNKIYEFKFVNNHKSYYYDNDYIIVSNGIKTFISKKLTNRDHKPDDTVYCTFYKYGKNGDPILFEIEGNFNSLDTYEFDFYQILHDRKILVYNSDKSKKYAVIVSNVNLLKTDKIVCRFRSIHKGSPTFFSADFTPKDSNTVYEFLYKGEHPDIQNLGIGINENDEEVIFLKCKTKNILKKNDKVFCCFGKNGYNQIANKFKVDDTYDLFFHKVHNNLYIICIDSLDNQYLVKLNYTFRKTLSIGDKIECIFQSYFNGAPKFKLPFYFIQLKDILKDEDHLDFIEDYLGRGYDYFTRYKRQYNEEDNHWILTLSNYLDTNIRGFLARTLNADAIKCIDIYVIITNFIKSAAKRGIAKYDDVNNRSEINEKKVEYFLNLKKYLEKHTIDDFYNNDVLVNYQDEFLTFFAKTKFEIIRRDDLIEILNNIKNSSFSLNFIPLMNGLKKSINTIYQKISNEYNQSLFLNERDKQAWVENNIDELDISILNFFHSYQENDFRTENLLIFIKNLYKTDKNKATEGLKKMFDILDYDFSLNENIDKGYILSKIVRCHTPNIYFSRCDSDYLFFKINDDKLESIDLAISRNESIVLKTRSSFGEFKFLSLDEERVVNISKSCLEVIEPENNIKASLRQSIFYTSNILDSLSHSISSTEIYNERKRLRHFLKYYNGSLFRTPKSYVYPILDSVNYYLNLIHELGDSFNFSSFENKFEIDEKTYEYYPHFRKFIEEIKLLKYLNTDKNEVIFDQIGLNDGEEDSLLRKILIYNIIANKNIGLNKDEILKGILSHFIYSDNFKNKVKNSIDDKPKYRNILEKIYDGEYQESMNMEFKETLICPVLNKYQLIKVDEIKNKTDINEEEKNSIINNIINEVKSVDKNKRKIITHSTFKNICAMLNGKGGQIVIGIRDLPSKLRSSNNFEFPGIQKDFEILNGGWDELLLYFDDYFKRNVIEYTKFYTHVTLKEIIFNEKNFLVINIEEPTEKKPCIIIEPKDGAQKSYIRLNASTREMNLSEIASFKRERNVSEKPAYVYIVKNDKNQYKLGMTVDFEKRLSGLRTSDPSISHVHSSRYKTRDTANRLEDYLINRYTKYQLKRDWFEFKEEILEECIEIMNDHYKVHGSENIIFNQ